MNKYELALIVTAKIDDGARADVVEKAKGYITRAGGVISGVEEWGKKRLAYEIRYEREGYYYFIHFESEPSATAAIERDVRIMDNLLRYLIVRQDDDYVFEQPEAKEEVSEDVKEAATPVADEKVAEPEATEGTSESAVEEVAETETTDNTADSPAGEVAEDAAEPAAETESGDDE